MKKLLLASLALFLSVPVFADFLEGEEAFEAKRYTEAIQHFRPLADAGDFRSQYYMGYMYLKGYGVVKNDQLGLQYMQRSLDQNYHLAQAYMGFLYSEGQVVPADRKKAISLYQKAADQGNTSAMLNLGVAYYKGEGVPRNLVKAIELLEKIPVEQKAEAGRYLADIYLDQDSSNTAKAIAAYRAAAAAGDLISYNSLASMYLNGNGVDRDVERALKYYTYAASQGEPAAQYALGLLYVNGERISRNRLLGHAWLTWSANQGYAPAVAAISQLKSEMTLSELDQARQEFMNIQQNILGKIPSPFEEEQRAAMERERARAQQTSVRRRGRR
ncbi:MAG: sel1 repeat family protein [Alphaproteobacteria bacterium]|nr:sel1 repeat family protein [Alphaproteobacteria bacterium]